MNPLSTSIKLFNPQLHQYNFFYCQTKISWESWITVATNLKGSQKNIADNANIIGELFVMTPKSYGTTSEHAKACSIVQRYRDGKEINCAWHGGPCQFDKYYCCSGLWNANIFSQGITSIPPKQCMVSVLCDSLETNTRLTCSGQERSSARLQDCEKIPVELERW